MTEMRRLDDVLDLIDRFEGYVDADMIWRIKRKIEQLPPSDQIETNIYDIEEIHPNCTVQVLKNSVTGEVSVGWWPNEEEKDNA